MESLTITFQFEDTVATVSGATLGVGFDATLSAQQAFLIGRGSGSIPSNLLQLLEARNHTINLKPLFRYQEAVLDTFLAEQAEHFDVPPENALFEFTNNRVSAFRPASSGQLLNRQKTKDQLHEQLKQLSAMIAPVGEIIISLVVEVVQPDVATEKTNSLGIRERIGRGESFFRGSIPGREHNVALAASRVHGVLIAPGEQFSFNKTVGDISAATGYKQAYVIKNGRTILDDGGGVCQVSSTLFRAALSTGLPIDERWAHSYRVGYYEQGGWKPGFDATVYNPTYDLKFTNNTSKHILIQAYTDLSSKQLVFDFFGTSDGRRSVVSDARLWDFRPAPPALYQDDPTIPNGTVKQVDWEAPGVRSAFDYTVYKNEEVMFQKTFTSNFVPWQSVYLKGTQ